MIVAATHYHMTVKSYNSFKEKTVLSMYVLLLIQRAVPRVGAPGGTLRQRSLCMPSYSYRGCSPESVLQGALYCKWLTFW